MRGFFQAASPGFRCRLVVWFVAAFLAGVLCHDAEGGVPEVAHVYPAYAGNHLWPDYGIARLQPDFPPTKAPPQTLTGGNFTAEGLEVWVWTAQRDEAAIMEGLERIAAGDPPMPPAHPPEDATQVDPLTVEDQVIVARLSPDNRWLGGDDADWNPGTFVWVKSAAGISNPYLLHAAAPRWLSEEVLQRGQLLRIFGLGVQLIYLPTRVAFVNEEGVRVVSPMKPPFYVGQNDTRLLELILPADMKPGTYQVYVHNGLGGAHGWGAAGGLLVTEESETAETIFHLTDFGARGDGQTNDGAAIAAALERAKEADGGVVFFPPGVYVVDETVHVPAGVTLRGASSGSSVIRGVGFDPREERRGLAASVINLACHTTLEDLTVTGGVSKGIVENWGSTLVRMIPDPEGSPDHGTIERVTIKNCRLLAPPLPRDQHSQVGPPTQMYAWAISAPTRLQRHRIDEDGNRENYSLQVHTHHFRFLNNQVAGGHGVNLNLATRADVIGNTITGGAIRAGRLIDCLIERNIMRDSPTRFYSYRPAIHTYFRSNEMYNFGTRGRMGANEGMMLHSGAGGVFSTVTSATKETLSDAEQDWAPDELSNTYQTVLITKGRGFGQYRLVVANKDDTITVDRPWDVVPDKTSHYTVRTFFVDTAWFDNYLDGIGFFMLDGDHINVMIEQQRDHFVGGIDIRGRDSSHPWSPSWYTMMLNNQLDGSRLRYVAREFEEPGCPGPVLFANYIVGNNIVNPVHRQAKMRNMPRAAIDFEASRGHTPQGRVRNTVISDNVISGCAVGIRVPEWARKTFVLDNRFIGVRLPLLIEATGTVVDGNHSSAYSDRDGRIEHTPVPPTASGSGE